MQRILCLVCLLCAATVAAAADADLKALRPPSVPLVACDPYFSIWSPADRLTDAATVHWTGRRQGLHSMVSVDNKVFRLMGAEPIAVPPLPQTALQVLPTRTIYTFANEQIQLTLTFMTPTLPADLDVLSRPVTYLTWQVSAVDGKRHAVSLYIDASSELVVNTPEQAVAWARPQVRGLTALRLGSVDQPILAKKGDNIRIDWGYAYLAGRRGDITRSTLAPGAAARAAFAANQPLPADDAAASRAPGDNPVVMAFVMDCGNVARGAEARTVVLAYDDLYSVKFFGQQLRPYWRRNGMEAAGLLREAFGDHNALVRRCREFDETMMADLAAAGGERYARICALAYRQCQAAQKVVADANGQPLMFSKENFSNGCMGTVDVIYPAAPQHLLVSPALAKAALVPVLEYASSQRWKFPFAPHDIGTYPIANGQVYGGGERTEENQMPVEESGNMLILLAAVAQLEGNADFANKYWPVLTRWAEYLKSKGYDPENQLCTDDFAGHLAHNVNLSAKAIVALGAFAKLADMTGHKEEAATYRKLAEDFAARWVKDASDGDHYRLTFDKPGTWSQKYNLVWDRILGLKLFPEQVAKTEMAYYRRVQKPYGLPLDSRKTYTKLDWITWTACLTGSREDFEALVNPIYTYLNESPTRVPMSDWYETTNARQVGFQARSVVGGVFIRMLDEPAAWKKWARRAEKVRGNWAPLPTSPQARVVVPSALDGKVQWRYTLTKPADNWFQPDFADAQWKQGPGGFGSPNTPGAVVRTPWTSADIWLRREFSLPEGALKAPRLQLHHDEDAEVYLNGQLIARVSGFTTDYELIEFPRAALNSLKPGRNFLAIHCHQTGGGQYIDAGIVDLK